MVPMASAVATEEPQIAANRVQETTVTRPSEPRTPPIQAVHRSTSALATPPWRMKAAAITNSGSDMSVDEFSESMMTWAMPISGWPEKKNSAAAHAPSTRKIGMPAASRPKNITKKRKVPITVRYRGLSAAADGQFMLGHVPHRHGLRIEMENVAPQPDDVAHAHQQSAHRQGAVVKPHGEAE